MVAGKRPQTTRGDGPRFLMLVPILAVLAIGLPAWAGPQENDDEADPWAPLDLLTGSWEGVIDGLQGTGRGLRRYQRIIGGKYVSMRHTSVRLPQEKSPKGDQHEELGVFSFDSERRKIVFREFMIEGFVIRYVCETEPKRFVCTTESVESGPGIRARLTIEIADRYRFEEIYEIGWPGKELVVYFTNQWTRVPELD